MFVSWQHSLYFTHILTSFHWFLVCFSIDFELISGLYRLLGKLRPVLYHSLQLQLPFEQKHSLRPTDMIFQNLD